MAKVFRWMQFSDLHAGITNSDWLWPTSKKQLLDDIPKMTDAMEGAVDVVFFTGDITNSGSSHDFESATGIVEDIWECFDKNGSTPLLMSVPGNHDIARPVSSSSVIRALRSWDRDEELRSIFWEGENNEYRNVIRNAFDGYVNWYSNINVPKPDIHKGIMPGDFSAKISVNGLAVGVAGLNTAFLQLESGDYEGKLDLHPRQLTSVCMDVDAWCESVDVSFLMTHHGPDWLCERAYSLYESEIYQPWRFYSHLFGHMHEAKHIDMSHGGGLSRRYRQASSLFGLEHIGDEGPERAIGYAGGAHIIGESSAEERIWPRKSNRGQGGYYRITPDISYELNQSNYMSGYFDCKSVQSSSEDSVLRNDDELMPDENNNQLTFADTVFAEPGRHAENRLSLLPEFHPLVEQQHKHVRQVEQAVFESHIRQNRCAWLISDWGLGKEGFLACVLERINFYENGKSFRLSCEDVTEARQIPELIEKKFGLNINEFCSLNASSSNALIFDDMSNELVKSAEEVQSFEIILKSILDFCPSLIVVVITRQSSFVSSFEKTEIGPLDRVDVANYIANHPRTGDEANTIDVVDRLYMKSNGLPMYLERLIDALQVCGIDELVDEFDFGFTPFDMSETVPKALKQSVEYIAKSEDRYTKRSYKLLQALSVLPEGETLSRAKRLINSEPIYPHNAIELMNASLIKVDELPRDQVLADEYGDKAEDRKKLVVPRQVRDYVLSIMTPEQRNFIEKSWAQILLGPNYKTGELKSARKKLKQTHLGLGNEYAIISYLLKQSIKSGNEKNIKASLRSALSYAQALRSSCNYKDSIVAIEDFLTIIGHVGYKGERIALEILLGKSLRMIGALEKSITVLGGVLESGVKLTNNQHSTIYLSLALAQDSLGNGEEAIAAATKVQQYSEKESGDYYQAESVILENSEINDEKDSELRSLEKKARAKGCTVVANNILLELAARTSNLDEEESLYRQVSDSADDIYNNMRAIVNKVLLLLENQRTSEITADDHAKLIQAYSFVFFQRNGAGFNKCHKALWGVFKVMHRFDGLLQMFRFASFMWRLKGDLDTERRYLEELSQVNLHDIASKPQGREITLALNYFERRRLQVA